MQVLIASLSYVKEETYTKNLLALTIYILLL